MDTKERLGMIGERIRNARKRAKLSQTELGRRVGYSMNGIGKIERGESDPKFSVLLNIADVLDIQIEGIVREKPLRELRLDLFSPIFERVFNEMAEQMDDEDKARLSEQTMEFTETMIEVGKQVWPDHAWPEPAEEPEQ